MPQVSQMLPSTYLKKEDVTQPVIVTVDHLEEKNVAPNGQPEEMKWTIFFREFEKGMVLNSTNINALAQACASTDSDDWTGREVVLFMDPSVSYAGKVTGGLRIRPNETRQPVRPRPVTRKPIESQGHADEDIPASAYGNDR